MILSSNKKKEIDPKHNKGSTSHKKEKVKAIEIS
jgi:hypothetical protein